MACNSIVEARPTIGMASHEELLAELPKLDKMSHAKRQKFAKRRREEQLKKYKATFVSMIRKKKTPTKISFEINALLIDLISRNDPKAGELAVHDNFIRVYSKLSHFSGICVHGELTFSVPILVERFTEVVCVYSPKENFTWREVA